MNIFSRRIMGSLALATGIITMAMALGACGTEPNTPSVNFNGQPGGCADIFVYRRSADGTSFIVVAASKGDLGLSTQPRSFDLSVERQHLRVTIDRYPSVPQSLNYCNDVIVVPFTPPVIWKAIAGTVTIRLSKDTVTPDDPGYTATVQIENAVFKSPDGEVVTVPSATIPEVMVGWYAG